MITGTSPWKGKDRVELQKQIISCQIYYSTNVSSKMKELMSLILKKDPGERISIEQIRKYIQINFNIQSDDYFAMQPTIPLSSSCPRFKHFLSQLIQNSKIRWTK
jgi:serine/threonine protein kinase